MYKVNQKQPIQQTSSANTHQTSAGGAAINNQPIDVKNNPEAVKTDAALAAYIKSEEFTSLTPEKQIEALKERFFPTSTNDEVKQYLSIARQAIEKTDTEQAPAAADGADNTPAISDNVFENYAQKTGFKGTFDELIAHLKDLEKEGKLDEEGQKLLKQYESSATSAPAASDKDELIPADYKRTAEWRNLKVDVKITKYVEAFLEKNDPEYQKLTDKDAKLEYLNNQIKRYVNAEMPQWNEYSDNKKELELVKLTKVLEDLSTKKTTINEYVAQKTELRNKKQEYEELIPAEVKRSDEWRKLSNKEKLNRYIKAYLEKNDEAYNALKTDEEKEAYIKQKLAERFKLVGESPEEQKAFLVGITKQLELFDQAGISIDELLKMTPSQMQKKLEELNIEKQDPELQAQLKVETELLEQYKKAHGGREPENYADIYKYLHGLEKKGQLTEAQKKVLDRYDTLMKVVVGADKAKIERPGTPTVSLTDRYEIDGRTVEEGLKFSIDEYRNDKKLSNKEIANKLVKEISLYQATPEELVILKKTLLNSGFSEKEVDNILKGIDSKNPRAKLVSCNANIQNKQAGKVAADVEQTRSMAEVYGRELGIKLTEYDAKLYQNEDDLVAASVGKAKLGTDYAKASARGLNTYLPEDDANRIALNIVESDIPEASQSEFSYEYVRTAPTPQRQLSAGKTLSQADSPAVLEGLAAASKSVDKSVRGQYNNYVETAAKNYPPETQAVINTAMKTGEISNETLAKTTTSTAAVSDNQQSAAGQTTNNTAQYASALKTGQSQQAGKVQNETPQIARQTSTVNTNAAARTQNINANPAVGASAQRSPEAAQTSTSAAASYSADDTASAQSASQAQETAHLEQIKEEAMENAKETAETIQQSIDEHDAEKEITNAVDNVLEQLTLDGNITLSEKEKIKQQLIQAGSISKIYEIISQLGAKELFLDRIVNSSSFAINSFIDNIDDKSLIEDLYLRCSIDTIKKDLLQKLPQDRVFVLMQSKKITNLNDLDYKIIEAFLLKNIGTLHYQDFKDYAQYLPGDVREKLEERFREFNGIESETLEDNTALQADAQNQQAKGAAPSEADKTAASRPTKQTGKETPATTFTKKDGRTKILADGTEIRRSTFAGVSNVIDDNTFEIVPDDEDKTEKAMNDTVLTPGSDAWREKYSRYDYQAPTAFTMAALEESEFTGSYPPQTIPHWKYSNKTKKINFKG